VAERFLIVRLGALGDIVHAIPVAAALRRAYPAARIDWLVGARHRELLDLVPVLSRRVVINDRPTVAASSDGASWWRTILELRRARYDAAIDLQGLIKSAMLARASGAQRVLGFAASFLREPFARVFYTDVHDPGGRGLFDPRETRHVVEINLGLLRSLGIAAAAREFPIDAVESAAARDVQRQTDGRYALLNPGAAWPNKRWPPARLGAIAAGLREHHGLRSVVLWGPGEELLAREAVAASAGAAMLSPKTTIADIVAMARGAAVMLSGDTGPTHLAAAVGTPLVGLYGPTRAHRNGPWAPADITISRETICQCHHLRRCRLEKMCLLDIDVPEVAAALDRRLAAEATHVRR
jgi:heptosyltransferase I